jgi:hypothetical protein
MIELLSFMLAIWRFPTLNLCPEIKQSGGGVFWFYLVPPGIWPGSFLYTYSTIKWL